jgi:replicative DNA helicase
VESREGKRPQLSDLRESGAIEQDADIVTFIHRPEYYGITEDDSGNSLIGVAEIIIAKHRNGATGDVHLSFKKELAKFSDMETSFNDGFSASKTFSSKMNMENEEESLSAGIAGNHKFDQPQGNKQDLPF